MNKFVKFWTKKRLSNRHVKGCIILIALVVTPVVCALLLSDSMIKAMSDKYIYLSSGHLTVSTAESSLFDEYKEVKYSDRICSGYAMMYAKDGNATLYIKGVGSDYFNEDRLSNINFIDKVENNSNLRSITISEYTANLLGLNCGDRVAMMIVPDVAGKAMRPVIVQVSSIYSTGYEAIDANLAFVDFDYAKSLFINDDSISTELILFDDSKIDSVMNSILENCEVNSWMTSNYSVFSNFVTSQQVIFIILLVVIVMAGFYTASAARLANEDCIKDIAIFKMLGATDKNIYDASLLSMMLATLIGIISGLILGLAVSYCFSPVLKSLSNVGFDALKFYLTDFRVVIDWQPIIICLSVLLLISLISVSVVLRKTKKIAPLQLFNNY